MAGTSFFMVSNVLVLVLVLLLLVLLLVLMMIEQWERNWATLIVMSNPSFSSGFIASFNPSFTSLNWSEKRICIVGGGFGGLYTALNLAKYLEAKGKSKETSVTLISDSERFVYSPFLYELVTGELQDWEVAPVYTDVLKGTGVKFLQGKAQSVDKINKTISVDLASLSGGGKQEVSYDKLILATGGNSKDEKEGEPGVFGFRSLEDAKKLRARLAGLKFANKKPIKIAVVGGGYPGIELSCSLAANMKKNVDITIFQRGDKILPRANLYNRIVATQRLAELGVKKFLRTEVVEIKDDSVSWKQNNGAVAEDKFDIIIRASSSRPSVLNGLDVQEEDGRIHVNDMLKVKEEEDLYAVGDIARCIDSSGSPVPSTAQIAMQQAEVAAWNVVADLTGGVPLTFRRQDLGEMLSLGGYTASLSSKAFGLQLDDKLAHLLRREWNEGAASSC
ncbi:hypothetical protein GUITHDRAFT_102877 [Guillardia theta CCMP2712]|uniref:FAD/NAD(P)-binding domain-containing protein n=1 Tax=Guillardia theta (strain CCMP2712) TaxID=905079 RepID=L1JSR9_GUITC|nr:hypothetical protein GUITHDRAFT_102877 [Guillardia theta CCMP2712]EKX51616.1 hypothetical protein GUITHDRAFT_102877 [Guillardia theta CCMP2712]|eukprot:XP_005838596.1 hypothetical protein GUITHDRAFT_102877 [Guillardia theta CCMP2712]